MSLRHTLRGASAAAGVAVLAAIGALAVPPDALAQASKAAKAKQVKDAKAAAEAQRDGAAQAQRSYAAGVRAFEAGDLNGAEQQLSAALAGGGLPNGQMARALYYRGSAYRQMGRPAQAISDLTTAVWLKGGLPPDLKTKAVEARKLAYQEAGLGESPPPVGSAPLDQAPATAGAPAPAATSSGGTQVVTVTPQSFWSGISVPSLPSLAGPSTPAQPAQAAQPAPQAAGAEPAPSSFWSFLPSFGSSSQPAEQAPPAANGFSTTTVAADPASAPAMGFAAVPETSQQAAPGSSWDTQTANAAAAEAVPSQNVVASYVPPPDAMGATAPSTPPPSGGAAWSNPLAGTGEAVTGFFSNMFGSGNSAGQPPADGAVVTTGSTDAVAVWGADTQVMTSQTSSMVQRGPDSPPAAETMPWAAANPSAGGTPARPARHAAAAATAGAGQYKLQVAAVRSREEAERLAQSLSAYPAVRDGTVSTEIEEAVIGSMGTFYQVRLGPYANASEPGDLCKTLKPQGFDCLVVTQ